MARHDLPSPPTSAAVDVWLLSLAELTDDARAFHERFLADDELARARRYVSARARDQFVAARAVLRSQLSRLTRTPLSGWRFEANLFGRPRIAEPVAHRYIRFNLSHTDGLVACAVSIGHEIGVDVENVTRDLDVLSLAKSFFAPPEAQTLAHLEPAHARSRFFSYWTLKESYIKARGMGLSLPLDAFWFDLDRAPGLHCDARCDDAPERWQFFLERPTPEHRLALAVAAPAPVRVEIRFSWLTHALTPSTAPDGINC